MNELEQRANKAYENADSEYISCLDESELFVQGYIAGATEETKENEIETYNKIGYLEAENERLKLQLSNFEENVTNIITNFWCWYVSGNHKRDLSHFEEGKKYANNFFNDLIKEVKEWK